MPGQLFTQYFLGDGISNTPAWQDSLAKPDELASFRAGAAALLAKVGNYHEPNEAATEQDVIRPLLELLGWNEYLPQQGSQRNEDIPDHLLFGDAQAKARAAARPADKRYADALVVAESKRFGLTLDDQHADPRGHKTSPHGQILRYLATADIHSDSRIRWGILTNGQIWRLYDRRARPRASGFHQVDLEDLLQEEDSDGLRAFRLLFGRPAFTPQSGARTSFLEDAIAEGRRNEEQVAQDLSGTVFEKVYPALVNALASAHANAHAGAPGKELGKETDDDLPAIRQAALIFLYRLLFLLYAEDRNLLPVNEARYADYGLRNRVRNDIAERFARGDTFSTAAANYYNHIATLCRQIDKGDPSIGLPPYNGGLFAPAAAPLLQQVQLADAELAPIIYDLSHAGGEGGRRYVNYRDMTVQQLGSIYERLLEREPARGEDGAIVVRPNSYARKDSGSYYTPQSLVDLLVERTLKPLIDERREIFDRHVDLLKSSRRDRAARVAELRPFDPAQAALDLKLLDPAMGSGHFLVTAVDYLSDAITELIEYAPTAAPWLQDLYSSPLLERIAAIRQGILGRAEAAAWVVDKAQLTDQAIIRRMVLKRCIYGVDKNPLTVELAKVSLWLHSFTVGAPLSFLDHHLRCGDSLIGLRVHDAIRELMRLGKGYAVGAIQAAENAATGMQQIEELSDAVIAEVEESAQLFGEVENMTAPLRGLLDTFCGAHWHSAALKKRDRSLFEQPLVGIIALGEEKAFQLLSAGPDAVDAADPIRQRSFWPAFTQLWRDASGIAARETFLHWEVAFPGVWQRWQDDQPVGGFDAVIGNPPWDHIEQPEVEWFRLRDQQVALAPTGARRKALIKQRTQEGNELALQYQSVRSRAAAMRAFVKAPAKESAKASAKASAKESGHYPLLSGGRVNLYSLFVERAMRLVKPDGIVGLLTPSGIYGDLTAARFFKSVSTSGRIGGLYDFQNRLVGTKLPPFFPDVDSRFKFCALIFGGEQRRFDQTECAFFLDDTADIGDPDRCFALAPADFARVNPNTGTAPVFRARRDADITRRIYENHPVLVNRSAGEEEKAWPVRFRQGLFNMTSDSNLFRTAIELDASGFYPVQGNRWKKGEELYLPLYQGRMIWHFDHRANSVRVNSQNTHNPYLSEPVSEAQHADPSFLPRSRYWVPAAEVQSSLPESQGWALGFRDITNSTNERTMVAAVVPWAGFGHKLPLLLSEPGGEGYTAGSVSMLAACVNSLALDFVARQKLHSTSMTLFIVEQLPVIAPSDYDRQFGSASARALVQDHVLRLTYSAHDMAPFARDLGYDGAPFIWNEEERRHLRARLDALYFHLYGLSKEDAAYILDTFPIVRRHDKAAFGHYRTKAMILAYYNALGAGDTSTDVAV